ncbi:MAG TPA: hypothetical protein PJ982_16345, partial [Lacipirellulaceae bacterium]|nr:hypothetical protein [Lacipirellulaceae bacterium]
MDQPKESPKSKSPDKKPAPQANNLLWYMLGLLVLLLLLVTMWGAQDRLTIPWSELERLVVASNPDAPESTVRTITFVNEALSPPIEFMLSELAGVRIGVQEVTGTVLESHRQHVDGGGGQFSTPRRATFRTPRNPEESRLANLLAENNIPGWTYEEPPSPLIG